MTRLLLAAAALAVLTPTLAAQKCRLLGDLHQGSAPSSPEHLTSAWGDVLLFAAAGNGIGVEPWIAKGIGKPTLLKDVRPSSSGSFPRDFVVCGRLVFFTADDGNIGRELYVTDGTTAGTQLVKDVRPGARSSSDIRDLVRLDDAHVLFRADDGTNGPELWVSDGTAAGTRMVKDIRPGANGSDPNGLVLCAGRVFFAANDGSVGNELWVSDGTSPGTLLVKDLNPGVNSSAPRDLYSHGAELVFTARDAQLGYEPWSSDGTAKGTRTIGDLNTAGDSHATEFTTLGNALLFVAASQGTGYELWIRDAAGTRIVRDILPGGSSSSPKQLTRCGKLVFFSALTTAEGIELWRSDGTTAGTQLVQNIRSGSASSTPDHLLAVGDRLYFQARDDKATGLWLSDGSTAMLSGTGGLTGGFGFVLLDFVPRTLFPVPFRCQAAVTPSFILGAVGTPTWTMPFPIPNDPSLDGICLPLQTWWLPLSFAPISPTNAIMLGIGN